MCAADEAADAFAPYGHHRGKFMGGKVPPKMHTGGKAGVVIVHDGSKAQHDARCWADGLTSRATNESHQSPS